MMIGCVREYNPSVYYRMIQCVLYRAKLIEYSPAASSLIRKACDITDLLMIPHLFLRQYSRQHTLVTVVSKIH